MAPRGPSRRRLPLRARRAGADALAQPPPPPPRRSEGFALAESCRRARELACVARCSFVRATEQRTCSRTRPPPAAKAAPARRRVHIRPPTNRQPDSVAPLWGAQGGCAQRCGQSLRLRLLLLLLVLRIWFGGSVSRRVATIAQWRAPSPPRARLSERAAQPVCACVSLCRGRARVSCTSCVPVSLLWPQLQRRRNVGERRTKSTAPTLPPAALGNARRRLQRPPSRNKCTR